MQNALGGNPASDQGFESLPGQAGFLTTQAELPPPESDDSPPEGPEGPYIARYRMVVEIPFKVAKRVVEFSSSIPRAPLCPGYRDGLLGVPLQEGWPCRTLLVREQGDRRGPSRTTTPHDA
jgi:hypothetical protein